ncbi:MAG: DUF3592 domain-containing protein [Deltaproteobacteria bacterium]|nr:DUF3592 domain-containing protein [Deltaproteobacteria bacterium]
MPVLPSRPLTVDEKLLSARRRKAGWLSLMFIVFGALMTWFGLDKLHALRRDLQLWERGTETRDVRAEGQVTETSKLGVTVGYDYEFDVAWVDGAGAGHDQKVRFDTMWSPIDDGAPLTLRYDPSQPKDIVLSWQVQKVQARLGWTYLAAALVLLMIFATLALWKKERELERLARVMAEDSEELEVELLSVHEYKGNWTVKARAPDDSTEFKSGAPWPPMEHTRDGKRLGVALRSGRAPGEILLVGAGGQPFVLRPE